jgi:hypothetical protein
MPTTTIVQASGIAHLSTAIAVDTGTVRIGVF